MTALTPEITTAILEQVRRGIPPNAAAEAAGITHQTLNRWQAVANGAETWPGSDSPVDPATRTAIVGFAQQLSRAKAEAMQTLVSSLYYNATHKNEKTGHYDTQAADKLLSKAPQFRSDWHEERHVVSEQSGTISHVHEWARSASDADLLDAAPELAMLLPPSDETGGLAGDGGGADP